MDRFYSQYLQHPQRRVRKNYIIAYAKQVDTEALDALLWVSENDPEPKLRDLAFKSWQHIKREAALRDQEPVAEVPTETPRPAHITNTRHILENYRLEPERQLPTASMRGWREKLGLEPAQLSRLELYRRVEAQNRDPRSEIVVTDDQRKKAKMYVEHAMTAFVAGKYQSAGHLLIGALELNPYLSSDAQVVGVLANIYGLPADQVIAEINLQNELDHADGKRKARISLFDWRETQLFLMEMGVWYVVLTLLLLMVFLTKVAAMKNNLQQMRGSIGNLSSIEQQMVAAFDRAAGWDATGSWVQASLVYAALMLFLMVLFAIFTWLFGQWVVQTSSDLYVFVRAMVRGTVAILCASLMFWGMTNELNPNAQLGVILTLAPVVVGLVVAGYFIGRGEQNGYLKGMLQIWSSVAILGALIWWITVLNGLLSLADTDILKSPLPNLPAYVDANSLSTAQNAASGAYADEYAYPWNLLPLPPGLPLPEQPLHEYFQNPGG